MTCTHITKHGRQCKIPTKESVCHIHRGKLASKLEAENNRLQATQYLLDSEITALQLQLKSKSKPKPSKCTTPIQPILQPRVEELERQLKAANDKINQMQPDYDRFQIVKQFELRKKMLEQSNVDFHRRGIEYHRLRMHRNAIVHEVC